MTSHADLNALDLGRRGRDKRSRFVDLHFPELLIYLVNLAELRDHGLIVADQFFEPVELDLGAVLERAVETPLWG